GPCLRIPPALPCRGHPCAPARTHPHSHAPPQLPRRRKSMSRSDVLVDADWVQDNLDNADIAIVEVDEDTSAYEKNHIRGAIRIDWNKDLQDPVRRDFIDQEGFEKLLSAKGIANDTLVILYGGNNNWFASYAYWYFKLYGHENVKLLDGGRKKWELDARELVEEVPERTETTYTAKPQN